MTKNSESTSTMRDGIANLTNILEPRYTDQERHAIAEMRSRINVARAVLGARLDLGFTQGDLGTKAGTKQSRVSEIEAMKGNPRFDTLDRIAAVLGLMIVLVPRQMAGSRYLKAGGYSETGRTVLRLSQPASEGITYRQAPARLTGT